MYMHNGHVQYAGTVEEVERALGGIWGELGDFGSFRALLGEFSGDFCITTSPTITVEYT